MSDNNTMSPEDFITWATAEIEIAKGEKGDAAIARLENVRKQVEVAKAFSFEGDVAGLPVEQAAAPAPSATEVSPDKAGLDDPKSTTASNFDDVAKRLAEDLAALSKGKGDETKNVDGKGDDGKGDDGKSVDNKGKGATDVDKNVTDKGDETVHGADVDETGTEWPDDLNNATGDLTWGPDGGSSDSE